MRKTHMNRLALIITCPYLPLKRGSQGAGRAKVTESKSFFHKSHTPRHNHLPSKKIKTDSYLLSGRITEKGTGVKGVLKCEARMAWESSKGTQILEANDSEVLSPEEHGGLTRLARWESQLKRLKTQQSSLLHSKPPDSKEELPSLWVGIWQPQEGDSFYVQPCLSRDLFLLRKPTLSFWHNCIFLPLLFFLFTHVLANLNPLSINHASISG